MIKSCGSNVYLQVDSSLKNWMNVENSPLGKGLFLVWKQFCDNHFLEISCSFTISIPFLFILQRH
jgi:hypothetical protein